MMAHTALRLFSTSALFCMSLAYPSRYLDGQDRLYSDLLAELRSQQATTGTCAGAGHTSGCCLAGRTGCRVNTGSSTCFCDIGCHYFHDCCSDVAAIGCLPNTCTLAGLPRGCCTGIGNSCFVRDGNCYCDRTCHFFNDCCSDVTSVPSSCSDLPISQRMRMKELAQEMSAYQSRGRPDTQRDSLQSKYQAGISQE